jgi:ribosome-interacting GTPase 1
VSEKLKYLEEMLAIMPRHEGTDKLTADLRRRLAQLKDMGASRQGSAAGHPFTLVEPHSP